MFSKQNNISRPIMMKKSDSGDSKFNFLVDHKITENWAILVKMTFFTDFKSEIYHNLSSCVTFQLCALENDYIDIYIKITMKIS